MFLTITLTTVIAIALGYLSLSGKDAKCAYLSDQKSRYGYLDSKENRNNLTSAERYALRKAERYYNNNCK